MSRYDMLVRVLDELRAEAKETKFKRLYAINSIRTEEIWQARARAYVHLYLKVMFGITDFSERETYITDGSGDGGIDGYYIDTSSRKIILIQSKFRNSEENFETKPIDISEILAMQVKRILNGESEDDDGVLYNGKICGLQRRISEIPDIGRYSYKIVLIANVEKVKTSILKKLTDGIETEIVNFRKSYKDLLYPVISGTLFKAVGVSIYLDLSNKSSGSKISYSVSTDDFECDITVIFVPISEIARIMSHYKNSILLYNPRSYLEFIGEKVNSAIRETVTSSNSNEFALLNNGITIICDEVGINEQSGRKYRAQLFLLNPQIINGGQTAYTLSIMYDSMNKKERDKNFAGKEVLVKTIALTKHDNSIDNERSRIALIEKISAATNSQTVVTLADRTSNDPLHSLIQSTLFDRHGLLYERKRGEFGDGLRAGYISPEDVIDRATFTRLYLVAKGRLKESVVKKIAAVPLGPDIAADVEGLERFVVALDAFRSFIAAKRGPISNRRYTEVLPKVYAACVVSQKSTDNDQNLGQAVALLVQKKWSAFLKYAAKKNAKYIRVMVDEASGNLKPFLRESRGTFGETLKHDIEDFFGSVTLSQESPHEVEAGQFR